HAGALQIGKHGRLTRNGPFTVVVRGPIGIVGRCSMRDEVLRLSQTERIRCSQSRWLHAACEEGQADKDCEQIKGEAIHNAQSSAALEQSVRGRGCITCEVWPHWPAAVFSLPWSLDSTQR